MDHVQAKTLAFSAFSKPFRIRIKRMSAFVERLAWFDQRLFLKINNSFHSSLGDVIFGYTTWLGDAAVLLPIVLLFCIDWTVPTSGGIRYYLASP